MSELLSQLLLNFGALSDDEVLKEAKRLYIQHYCSARIPILTHDSQRVVFTEERFDHAFFSTDDKINKRFGKHVFVRERAERIHWIGAIIGGRISPTECWKLPPRYAAASRQRLYAVWNPAYAVWLFEEKDGWRFSTAYGAATRDLRRYTGRGTFAQRIWTSPRSIGSERESEIKTPRE